MKIRCDYVTNSSSSSFVTYIIEGDNASLEIEYIDTNYYEYDYFDETEHLAPFQLKSVLALNKLLKIDSLKEMSKLLAIDKEYGICLYSVYKNGEHIKYDSLENMIDDYDKDETFKVNSLIVMEGEADTYGEVYFRTYDDKMYEHAPSDYQVILNFKEKSLSIKTNYPNMYNEEKLYSDFDSYVLKENDLFEKRTVIIDNNWWTRDTEND